MLAGVHVEEGTSKASCTAELPTFAQDQRGVLTISDFDSNFEISQHQKASPSTTCMGVSTVQSQCANHEEKRGTIFSISLV